MLLDITQRKQAEAELAHERELLRSLLDSSPDHIYFKDRQSRFIRASRELAGRFGVTPEAMVGKSDFDFFQEEHARPAYEDEQEIIRTGNPVLGKVERETIKGRDGEFFVLTTKMPLRDPAGEIVGTFGISKDITGLKRAEARLETAHKQLVETSRLAGMAEVATSVLHNVGNVLNSVNISGSLIGERVKKSKVSSLAKVAALFQEHAADLPGFFAGDPRGRQLPGYLSDLAAHLGVEQEDILQELASLAANIEHIKEIVNMQQSYARVAGVTESLPVVDLIEDALRMNAAAMERHQVNVIKDYLATPLIDVDKHKILQILVNLMRNAKYALDEAQRPDKRMILRVESRDGRVQISVIDNGIGIPAENLTRIFEHGFTTRKHGHGFGLHSGALVAKELGGSLTLPKRWAYEGCGVHPGTSPPAPQRVRSDDNSGRRPKNRRILVVDDNRSIHDDFRKILCGEDAKEQRLLYGDGGLAFWRDFGGAETRSVFQITSAFQGQEGLAQVEHGLQNNGPVCDGVRGRAHAARLGRHRDDDARIWKADPDIQIVICTAYSGLFLGRGHRQDRQLGPDGDPQEAVRHGGGAATGACSDREVAVVAGIAATIRRPGKACGRKGQGSAERQHQAWAGDPGAQAGGRSPSGKRETLRGALQEQSPADVGL